MIDVKETAGLITGVGAALVSLYKGVGFARTKWQERSASETTKMTMLHAVTEAVGRFEPVINDIQKELKANGGGSLRDVIVEIRNEHAIERTARRLMNNVASYEVSVKDGHEHKVLFVSPAYVRLTGLTAEEAEDGGWIRSVAPDERDRVLQRAQNSVQNGTVFSITYTLTNVLTGETTMVEHTGTPVFNYAGIIIGWVGVLRPRALSRPDLILEQAG